jgi:glycosyltransferase involved in cell wall biosynthesis
VADLSSIASAGSAGSGRQDGAVALVVAMKDTEAALAYMRREGIEGSVVGALSLISRRPLQVRRRILGDGVARVIFHSIDWSRETAPQLPELVSLLLLGLPAVMVDDTGAPPAELTSARRLAAPGRTAAEAVIGSTRALSEYGRARRVRRPGAAVNGSNGRAPAVLAVWLGGLGVDVGGSVTHISGILGGFRAHGHRITLLTNGPAPAQLAAVVDNVEIATAPPRSSRLTGDIDRVATNLEVRRLGLRLAARDRPAFVYQRHRPLLAAGLQIAQDSGRPLVLEWNASEVWTRRHWAETTPVGGIFDGMLADMERRVVAGSRVVAAVSREAREMALEVGAESDRVPVVPNASDVAGIARTIEGIVPAGGPDPLIGWIGSFGPWHGAEVLVQALAHLPDGYRLRMIGDGAGRIACERLAAELGVAARVEFLKRLPHQAALRELAACDLLASPHVPLPDRPFFGSPTKLFEYMALGRPIVASRLDQLGELLEDGVTARLVTPSDARELAEALIEVWSMPDHGAALGAAALAEARAHHTWDHRAEQVLDALSAR